MVPLDGLYRCHQATPAFGEYKAVHRRGCPLSPILTSLSRSAVSDPCFTSSGNAKVRRKLAK